MSAPTDSSPLGPPTTIQTQAEPSSSSPPAPTPVSEPSPSQVSTESPTDIESPVVPGAFGSSIASAPHASTPPASSADASANTPSSTSSQHSDHDKPLPSISHDEASSSDAGTHIPPEQPSLAPSPPEPQLTSSIITTISPVRRSVYKRKMSSKPKGILKPAPPPQKGFSFRRDILENINSRLAQQGVNMQVPLPQGSTAQATASYIGGMFRRIGGIAAGAAANVGGANATSVGGLLSNDSPSKPNAASATSNRSASTTTFGSSSGFAMASSQTVESEASSSSSSTLIKSNIAAATTSAAPLKKVQFQVSHMAVTYPIVGAGTPEDEDLTRLRIERQHRRMLKARRDKPWTPEELEALYRECCRTREEHPLKKMRLVFQEAAQSSPPALKTLDLSFVPLDRQAVEPIADLLSIDFGLNKLVLENCALTDDSLKSILHALLVSGTLPNLSIASNRKIRFRGWRYLAIFMRRARALRYLDLSENSIDRASLEHLLAVITKPAAAVTQERASKQVPTGKAASTGEGHGAKGGEAAAATGTKTNGQEAGIVFNGGDSEADEDDDDEFFDNSGEPLMPTAPLLREVSDDPDPPSSAVISLRLENCGLKAASLEMLSQSVRFSDIRHLSLRRNKIGQLASVALAIMLKDYPDMPPHDPTSTGTPQREGKSYFDANGAPATPSKSQVDAFDRSGRTPRPTDAQSSPERRTRSYSPGLPEVPVIVSSPGGGITSRKMPSQMYANGGAGGHQSTTFYGAHTEQLQDAMQTSIAGPGRELDSQITPQEALEIRRKLAPGMSEEEAVSIYQAKRARRILAELPRVGNLLTLDLKSNDIRGGVVYLAQVLKKNRTLRVLNLSDNNIEMPGLVAIAEALKYNSTLETLDMSHNPCSGPGLEGITTLRTAFALNSNLKRLFLNDTDLSSEAAIALAEFLPEARSLIHLDLAENFEIDIAGVMALAVSLRMNRSLRCLDLNIPPNNPDFARLSQEILQSCVRNTELAQQRATQKGLKQPIAAPIYKSVVARAARENDERIKAIETARATAKEAAAAKDRAAVEGLLSASVECQNVLRDLLTGEEKRQREAPEQKVTPPGDSKLRRRLAELAGTVEDETVLARILAVHDELGDVSKRLEEFYRYGSAPAIDVRAVDAGLQASGVVGTSASAASMQHLTTPDQAQMESGLSSPAFSIADSDESDSDDGAGSAPAKRAVRSQAEAKDEVVGRLHGLRIDTTAADREVPEDDGCAVLARSPGEDRAKGQLSEEAELFRKARSLGLDEDDDARAGDSAQDESGEQLRQDLLQADVPPKSSAPADEIQTDAAA
ncbi:hypothetical protein PaG_03655 [Moesziomyces aphidis]|uniref:RNI-like protein n=1 Tax=Moesziomyces aphidis TaxID=84754 RepID=W3VKQ5_MOEAP|nr:hypothetical protein PaG_03655 [Moesziomyces aphidis]